MTKHQDLRAFSAVCQPVSGRPPSCSFCQVRKDSLCAALKSDEIQQLDMVVVALSKRRGTTIFAESEPAESLYVLTEGTVRLSKLLPDGRRQITGFLFPGDFMGESPEGFYACDAEAVTDCQLCSFSTPALRRLTARFPQLKDRMMAKTSNELAQAREHILLLGQKTATEKVATVLLNFCRRLAGTASDGVQFPLSIERQDLADYLGVRIETVSRVMSRFRREALIAEHKGEIMINDVARLTQIASCEGAAI